MNWDRLETKNRFHFFNLAPLIQCQCNTDTESTAMVDLVNWGPQAKIGMGPYTFAHIYLDQPWGSFSFVVMLAAAQWCPIVESNVSTLFMYMLCYVQNRSFDKFYFQKMRWKKGHRWIFHIGLNKNCRLKMHIHSLPVGDANDSESVQCVQLIQCDQFSRISEQLTQMSQFFKVNQKMCDQFSPIPKQMILMSFLVNQNHTTWCV